MKLIDKIEVGKDIYGCPDAIIPIVAAQLASEHGQAVYIARDDARMSSLIRSLEFIAPQIEALRFLHGTVCPMTGYHLILISYRGALPVCPDW